MRTWAKGTARAALLTASFVALGAGTVIPGSAYAGTTNGDESVLGGNQINLPISIPINISGNAVSVAGDANAGSKGGASVVNSGGGGGGGGNNTSGRNSVAGGNQINAPISAPIDLCGNAIGIFGDANAGCKGGARVQNSGGGAGTTKGNHSVGGGNQVYAPISAPVNVCGNSAAIFGEAVAGCEGGATVKNTSGRGSGQRTSGKGGVVAGNQVTAPVSAPIVACGNAVAVLGEAKAECEGGATVKNTGSAGGGTTSGKHGVLAGNQVFAPISAPVNVCGNAAAVLGDASAGCAGTAIVGGWSYGGHTTGEYSVGGGNQITAPVSVPVNVCGNVITVLGSVDPSCGNGALVGGAINARHRRIAHAAPAVQGLPVLPVVPGLAQALPVSPGSALPALPQLPVRVPEGLPAGLPMSAPADGQAAGAPLPQLPVQVPSLPQLPVEAPALPDGVQHFSVPDKPRPPKKPRKPKKPRSPKTPTTDVTPGTPSTPSTPGTPGTPGTESTPTAPETPASPGTSAAPGAADRVSTIATPGKTKKADKTKGKPTTGKKHKKTHKAGTPKVHRTSAPYSATPLAMLTDMVGALPTSMLAELPGGMPAVPTTPQLPVQAPDGLPVQLPGGIQHQAAPAPITPELPALPDLPVVNSLPISGHLNPPQVGGVTDSLGRLRPAASVEPLSAATSRSTVYLLTIGGLLAAASAATALGRRIRFGRK